MTRDVLLDLLRREPFKRLTLTLSNCEAIIVDDPTSAKVGRNFLLVPGQQPGTHRTITLHHVLSVESENAPSMEGH